MSYFFVKEFSDAFKNFGQPGTHALLDELENCGIVKNFSELLSNTKKLRKSTNI